ncbi:MAG: cytochrome c oxidase accessory protein CcoG [Myxococcales bacterium]|nr:cytochrome c oxidase accessory protein CcoG [Myxococcales bacterium]
MLNARPVRGRFRRLRSIANAVLIAVLFAIPWVRIDGAPLVLLDIPERRFHVFGLVIFPQELFFLWLIVIGLALALFFFTALGGRLWCGWACPQTVFTDVFAGVARRIQGWRGSTAPRRVARWRKVATHAAFLAMSAVIALHLVGYFHPIDDMSSRIAGGRPLGTAGGFFAVFTALVYFDFAILRQTFCKYLCPYARFQSVLFDADTLVIGYDRLRGEPRGKRGVAAGDCVDCGLCVAVCPTGIDIREGMQMECIACTQCIDACDGVMARIGRERGLIDYRSLVGLERLRPLRLVRPRVLAYGALLAVVVIGFGTLLAQRSPMELQVSRNRTQMTGSIADGRWSNAYTLYITNRDVAPHRFEVSIEAPDHFELLAGVNPIPVAATTHVETRVFVVAPSDAVAAGSLAMPIEFHLRRIGSDDRVLSRASTFVLSSGSRSRAPRAPGGIHAGH